MAVANDPWLLNPDGTPDPFAANIKWDSPDPLEYDEPISDGDPLLNNPAPPEPEAQPQPQTTSAPVVEDESPEVFELEDGTQLTLSKEKGWWVGSVVGQAGSAQRYKGETKNRLIVEILKAQANATKKIREQNLELKLGKGTSSTHSKPAPEPATQPANRQLTADELFEIKTQLESNPELALDNLFQKKTGMTIQQLVNLAKQGADKGNYANNILAAENATKTFLQNNPDYYQDPQWENFKRIVKWVTRFKIGESVKKGEEEAAFDRLVSAGVWTTENIEEAFADLSADDLLIRQPQPSRQIPQKTETPSPVQVPQEPAPAQRPDTRIVKTEVRSRAALGLRTSDITPVKPPEERNALTAEELDDLPDDQIKSLLNAIARQRAVARRSN